MEKGQKSKIAIIVAVVVIIILLFNSTVTIGSGEAGVLYKKFGGGVVTDQPPMNEGFHFVAPWNTVFVYNVRQQEAFEKMQVLSSNGLQVKIDASAWFQPDYEDLGLLHREKGQDYKERILLPALRSAARSVIGRYTPEQLYSSKRDVVQDEIFEEAKTIVDLQYIQLNEILVREVTLPPTIKKAIERKLEQEQESLQYEFKLTRAQKEAQRQKIEAEGKARANRILNASLTDKILKEKGIQATVRLSQSDNAKVIVIGNGSDDMPIILGNQ